MSVKSKWKDPEFVRAYQRAYQKEYRKCNGARLYELTLRWRARNPKAVQAITRRWNIKNREKKSAHAHMRRAAAGYVSPEEWQALKDEFDNRCACCGERKKLTRDHVVPLVKGGLNVISNIQPLCGNCNSSKHARVIDYRPKWRYA